LLNCEQVTDDVCFVLDQHTELDFYRSISLKQQSTDRHVTPLVIVLAEKTLV